jgi:ubiquinone biosynthesis protein
VTTAPLARAIVSTWLIGLGVTRVLALKTLGRRERAARVLARTLERLGPTYIKLGQILATRRDMFPPEVIEQLERLQDSVEPASFRTVPERFYTETGFQLGEVFAELHPEPLASASIACVYRGVLLDGTPVALKARRPDVVRRIELDLRVIRAGARLAARLPHLRGLPVLSALDELQVSLLRQVDLREEAASNRRVRGALVEHTDVVVPVVFEQWSSASFLTMELLPLERRDNDARCRRALLAALRAHYRLIFVEGFVHCDLHGANLFLFPDGRAAMIDFGFMAELSERTRLQFAEFFLAMATDDGPRCAQITVETAAFVPAVLPYGQFEADVCELVGQAAGATVEEFRVADFVLGLFAVQRRYGIVGTPTFTMAIVALLVFEGVANEVAGDLDFTREAVPFVLRALSPVPLPAAAAN